MLVALARFDLKIPGCRSLKEKRHVVKGLTTALRQTFNVSVAEVDHHELWQRTALGVAAVAGEGHHVRRVMQEIERFVEGRPDVETIAFEVTIHAPED